jgi:hypothetical protein
MFPIIQLRLVLAEHVKLKKSEEFIMKVKIKWPDTLQVEEGIQEDEKLDTRVDSNEDEILFRSDFDGTVNWIPKRYLIK